MRRVSKLALAAAGFTGGVGLAVQASLNAALAKPLGSAFAGTSFSFLVGVCSLTLLYPFSLGNTHQRRSPPPPPSPPGAAPASTWMYVVPGCIGAFFVSLATAIGPHLGFSLFFVCLVLGQLTMALVVDNIGLLGTAKSPLTCWKILAVVLVLAGALMAVVERLQLSGEDHAGLTVLYVGLTIVAGALMTVQVAVTNAFTRIVGTYPHRTALLAFSVGCAIVLAIWGVAAATSTSVRHPDFAATEVWQYFGGCLGAAYVAASVALAPELGVALWFIVVVAGQLTAAVLIDGLGLFNVAQKNITALRAAGVCVTFVGAIAYRLAPSIANEPDTEGAAGMSAEEEEAATADEVELKEVGDMRTTNEVLNRA
jgi:transporter family-2 protein